MCRLRQNVICFLCEIAQNRKQIVLSAHAPGICKKRQGKRPVLIAGHGVRISNSKNEFRQLVSKLKIPVLLSWSAIDLLSELNPFNFGRSGVMGQRSSNFIVQNADLVVVLGSRLSLLQTGYDLNDFASKAALRMWSR